MPPPNDPPVQSRLFETRSPACAGGIVPSGWICEGATLLLGDVLQSGADERRDQLTRQGLVNGEVQ